MSRARSVLVALLGLALTLPNLALASDWEEIYTQKGVTVSRKEVEGSKFVAFKGETVYDAEIGKIVYVLMDNDHRVEWVDRLYTNHVIEQIGEFEYILYQAFDLPPGFASRDYVYHGKATRDPNTGVITLKMQSTTHPDAPETVGVRAELVNSRYVLTPEGPDKTRVEVEIMTDPKGWMPAWLVNLIQKSWPLETLEGIRGQLSKPYTGVAKLPGTSAPAPSAEEAPETVAQPAEGEAPTEATAAEVAPGAPAAPEGGGSVEEAPSVDPAAQ